MTFDELEKDLARRLRPVYLVAGEEETLVEQARDLILARATGDKRQAEITRFDGRGAAAADIDGAVRTVSLFGGPRVVLVKDAQDLRPAELQRLVEALKRPVSGSLLLLLVRGAGAQSRDPKRAKAARAAQSLAKAVDTAGGAVVDCPRPKAREMPAVLERMLARRSLRADDRALHAIAASVGEDLGAAYQAIEKLSLYVSGGVVQPADVAAVVSDTREESVFALIDAVSEGRTAPALATLRRLLRDGESGLSLLSQLVRHFRTLARVKALSRRRQNASAIQQALGLHPFVVQKCLKQIERFREAELAARLRLLAAADGNLKRSRYPERMEMERLILALCRGR
jgi:DNA polymerase-3 subunit delta